MSGYDDPLVMTYNFGSLNFATTPAASAIKPPAGFGMGRVIDIHVAVSVLFTQVTTPAYVRVGTAGDPDKYAELNVGAGAATDAVNLPSTSVETLIDMTADSISQVEVAFIAPTGGTPAGTGVVAVTIGWFK